MKRYITLALCALTVFGLGSCNKVHEEDVDSAIRTVTFQAQMGGDTRTGLALKFVPDWRETNLSDVHIYEIDGDERIEGEDIEMTIPGASEGNYEIALFKADFSNMTIIVNPPSSAPRTRASEEVFQYTAVVASQDAGKKFTVPATQYPAASTLIDPHADFIVGTSVQDFNESQAGKQVNLKFVRPVAVSRLSIMNVEDATIKQVKIYSSDKLTGSAAYGDVNFANGTVAFDNSGSNVLTLDYGTGVAMPAEGIFNAYFVSLTGTKRITKIEVVTNAQTLTKEFEGGKALTFKVPDFKSIAVNMAGTGSVEPGPGDPLPQNISFNKGGSAIEADSFDLYTGGTYVSPTVAGAATGATLTFSSSDVAVATVSSTGVVTPQGVGETTISVVASAVTGYQAGQAEYVLTVTDSTPEAVDQPLKFMKGGSEITTDEYDLYNGGTYASPTLTGAVEGATVTWEVLCTPEGCATMTAEGVVTPVAPGVVVVTATASAVAPLYKATTKSYTLTIKDTTPVVGPTVTINLEEATELVAGEKYVLVSNGFALVRDGENASTAAFDATAEAIAVPVDLQENFEWTLEKKSGSITRGNEYVFTQEGGYFFGIAMNTSQQTYTYTVEVNNGRNVSTNISIQDHNISLANNLIYYAGNSSNYYVFYNTASGIWDNEKVSNTASPAATSSTALYKVKDERAEQNLQFSAADAEYDLGTSTWTKAVPTLTGTPQGDVTYSSSDETVATVANDGTVTPLKKGTATITAKAAGNATYKPASASYELNVVNSNVPTYVKADEVESGKAYLIVSNGNVLVNNNGSAAVEAVTVSGGQIKYDAPDAALWTATVSSGSITFANGSRTLGRSSSNISLSASASFSYDSEHEYLTTKSSSTSTNTYYLYCTSSFRYSQNSVQNAALYVLDDGRPAQEISFSAADAEYDLYTHTWTVARPSLSGAQGDVTYSSSDETVATVTNTGDVTPLKVGTTTITAKAAGNATYKPGQASYTVTVVDTTPAASKTYTRISYATGITTGKYLIVNPADAQVFTTVTSYPNAVDVTPASGVISGDFTSYELTITKNGSEYTIQNSSNEYLYYVYTSGNTQSRVAYQGTANGTWSANAVSGDANGFDLNWVSGSSSQHIYWSETFFKIGSQTSGVHLYKLSDGTTPDPGPEPTTPSYTKVTSITSGATYLIVSADAGNYNGADGTKAFTGDQNGTAATVNNAAGVITGDYSAYEFVISASGSDYTLLGPTGYVTGNATSGSRYIQVSSTAGTMSLSMASDFTGQEGQVADAFYFYYTKTSGGSTSKEVLYFNKDGAFKVGGTGRKYGVYLYKKN